MRSPTDHTARLRGAAVGASSAAVAILAHGLGGGASLTDGSALALLLAACTVIGVVVASVRPRYGLAGTIATLAAGQAIGHAALWDLAMWRVIGGIGIGMASVIGPAYIAEVS
ncbi:hypothetical protein ACWELJ_32915, partial [Nocardia sp. NPDC004582]